jgi:hypothetical protein
MPPKPRMRPEEIVDNFGYLSLAQVHAALTYYYANKAEIDADHAMCKALVVALRSTKLLKT